ncbi:MULTISPECIES: cell division protein FtsQ/DivIB [unclassified Fusobacterium]|uniref:cell division protein FtsQ/DivIB n=1 Tax=unclassified Fusobacterium TaxID=2648384 RepID=UPI0025BBA5FC|nr:cell division protein FtsQ/DivIB [Fusobacterium sp.]
MKFIIRLIMIYLFSCLLYLIPSKFLSLDFFKIKEIKIEGNSKILSNELTELIEKLYNTNIWEIDIKKLEEYLKQDVRVEDVKIENPDLGLLKIKIKEKELAYYVQIKGKVYLLDQNGKIFGMLKERPEKDIYFMVAKDENDIMKLLELSKVLDDSILKNLISQIYIKDKDCIEIILLDGTIIKTNLLVEKEKYKILETLYNELVKTKKVEYIDIRFDDFIVKSSEEKNNGK